jgi:hypothetical protein
MYQQGGNRRDVNMLLLCVIELTTIKLLNDHAKQTHNPVNCHTCLQFPRTGMTVEFVYSCMEIYFGAVGTAVCCRRTLGTDGTLSEDECSPVRIDIAISFSSTFSLLSLSQLSHTSQTYMSCGPSAVHRRDSSRGPSFTRPAGRGSSLGE